jgi:uncharacterized membrane protein YoaK (UPF0700 family)
MNITLHTPETIYAPRHIPSWLLLAAAAGMVNGFAFLTCQQFVTHVTGTLTRLGLEWWHAALALEYAVVLAAFLAGAVVAVLSIQLRAKTGSRTRWATPLFSVALILTAVALGGSAGWFGVFGGTVASDPPPVVLLSILAFAMGMQNAGVASTTGLAVRTTHLTGPVTDLGIHLGTALLANRQERLAALRGAALRGGKIVAFVAGAGLSLSLSSALGYLILLPPAVFVLVAAVLSFVPEWSPSDYPYALSQKDSSNNTTPSSWPTNNRVPTAS